MRMIMDYGDGAPRMAEPSGDCGAVGIAPPAECRRLTVRWAIPLAGIQRYWAPALDAGVSERLPWRIDIGSAAQFQMPYLAFFSDAGINRATVSLTNLQDDMALHCVMNQADSTYDITLEMAFAAAAAPFELRVDCREKPWTEILTAWRDRVLPPHPDFPAAAWEPVFCTWYAVHAALTAAWVEANAAVARELGFGTLIVDDGWCFDVAKRVKPETMPDWYEWIGDWEVSKVKFPDFSAHVARVRAMGMKYMLWVAPFLWGRWSARYRELGAYTFSDCHEGCYHFDPAAREVAGGLAGQVAGVLEKYDLDGLKIDFLDITGPDCRRPNGRDCAAFIAGLVGRIRAVRRDALIEFRQCYATPAMLPWATQFRAADAPYDFQLNFERLIGIRLMLGDGVPIHADPAYWAENEEPENIARHFIAMLVGVPMLSMDLTALRAPLRKMIGFWLGFYQEHRELLNFGHWQFKFVGRMAAWARVENSHGALVIVADAHSLEEAQAGAGVVLNLSGVPLAVAAARGFDGSGEPVSPQRIPSGGGAVRC